MDLKKELLAEHSKAQTLHIASYIGQSPERFAELWELVQTAEPPIPQRGAWVLTACQEAHPQLLLPHLQAMADFLPQAGHDGVKRNLVRILAHAPLPTERDGELYDLCLQWLRSAKVAVAIQAWCMDIAARIAMPYPELREELVFVLQTQLPYGSAGFRSRGKKIIQQLTAPPSSPS